MKSVSPKTHDPILRIFRAVVVGIALMLFFAILSGYAGAAMHSETPITYFFPYWMIVLGSFNWVTISEIVFILQFPVYALIVDRARTSNWKLLAALILIALHIAAVILAFRVWRHS